MRNLFRARLLIIGLIVATGWSCTETLVGIVELAVVEIEPRTATVYIDADTSLRALLKDDRGNALSGRPVSWTSENPQVATVNAQGVVHGVSAGEADIIASSEGIRSTARITVLLRPAIHMEPDSAVFTMTRGAVPAATTIDIINTGGGTLSGMTVATDYGDGPAGWLVSSLSAANAPATLTITPVVSDLTPGTYRASLHISAADASNTPATLGIRFELLPAVPAHIAIAGGNDQSATAGTAVSVPIGVRVMDANDGAVENVAVTFAVASGGGSLASAGSVHTNADGIALAPVWTLGMIAGPNTLRATAEGLATDSVIITANAVPGTASQLGITTEPSASAPSGSAFARQPVLQLRDVGGNAVSQAGVAVTAAIAAGGGVLDGTVTVVTDAAGAARFSGLAINGTPGERRLEFTADGLASATSAAIAITIGAGTQLSLTAQPSISAQSGVLFAEQPAVQLQDAGGNPVRQAGILVTAGIQSGGGTLAGTLNATTDADGLARFTDLRISGTVGDRTLQFTASGITAATSDAVTITVGPASAAHTGAVVRDGIAGSATAISIVVHDDGGNPVTGEAARLAVSITGANTVTPTVTETGSGSYAATYTPSVTGTDNVAITLGGAPITGSPFISTVTPSGVSVSNSSVSLSPSGSVVANGQDAATVTVVLRDSIGNPIGGLASFINVSLSGNASAGPVVETSTTGTYMFNVTSTVANLVGIAMTVGGTTLTEKPTLDFVAGPVAIAVSAAGASPASGVAANGIDQSIVTVTLGDAFSNPVTGLTDIDFAIVLTGSAQRGVVTESGSPGTYTFTVTNDVAETITVTVTAGGVQLTQAPTIEFVAGGVSASLSTAASNPTTGVTADGVAASTVTVTLRDDQSNAISGLVNTDFTIGLTGSAVASAVTETPTPGNYTFTVTDTDTELVTVTVTASAVQITQQPTIDFVPGPVSASASTAASNPTTGVTADGVASSTVTVMLTDANANPIGGLAGSFSISLPTGASAGTVTETATGTYTFNVTSTVAGTVTVTITANSVQLTQQPTIQFVSGSVSGTLSTAAPSPATGVTADGATASTVTVTLVDDNGNAIAGVISTEFIIAVTGSAAATGFTETAPGTYTFTVTNTVAETVTLTMTARSVQLTQQPTIQFVSGGVSGTLSTAAPSPATGVTADGLDASTVTVTLVDGNGNAIAGVTSAEFIIAVTGSAAAAGFTETATPGTYTFMVTNTVAEIVTLTMTARTVQLTSQPTIEFVAGSVTAANSSVTASPAQVTTGGSN